MARVCVILPGGGSGKRFGASENKLFQPLAGRPLIMHTLELFAQRSDVIQLILVHAQVDRAWIDANLQDALAATGALLVEGGATRSESVRNALATVRDDVDLIAVHDAARPIVPQDAIDRVFAKAHSTGAAMLTMPIHGTVKRVEGDTITDTLDREAYHNLHEAQTPQVFQRRLLLDAYANGTDATDDAALVEQLGHPVSAVRGDLRNIKVTRPEDLQMAECLQTP
ncbi:MAG: 2-C-methyl-D-erythritol 4-phosphate cytidylyltransferase [Phycisphaerales bacterium]|jgi:2-C-methyl-D-erythritol 4-phosphate cytidylyltransferase|nr:2-C-methyl-D-erythritol 4-phosphate cytidylyltransferase [Phycisphaerales bacterium]